MSAKPFPPSRLPTLNITLKPVISPTGTPALAQINEPALEGDPLKEWMRLFTDRTEYGTTVTAVDEALSDPYYCVIKAVIPDHDSDNPTGEKIIGFVHYLCTGYIQLEQVDPFPPRPDVDSSAEPHVKDVKDVTSDVAEALSEQADRAAAKQDSERADRLRRGEAKHVETRNVYIGTIWGKKHSFIRRIMVLPEYQRRGVASALMKVVTDEADQLKIVCWLFVRPAGEPLYRKGGMRQSRRLIWMSRN